MLILSLFAAMGYLISSCVRAIVAMQPPNCHLT